MHTKGTTVWVAYVSSFHPDEIDIKLFLNAQIEMAVTIASSDDLPLVMYMGITRIPSHILDNQQKHGNLALPFMGFVAKNLVMQGKLYMSTVPLKAVHDLLKNNLQWMPEGSAIREYVENTYSTWIIKDKEHALLFEGQAPQWDWFPNYVRFLTNTRVLVDLNELQTYF